MIVRAVRLLAVSVAVVSACVTGVAAAPEPDSATTAAARAELAAGLEADMAANPSIPGEAIAVRAPGLDITAATGLADIAAGTPLGPETPFRVASMTKTFVAAAILRLVEQGKVDLDAPISKYISKEAARVLRADGYRVRQITVRQLLRHTAGLYDYAESDAYDATNVADPGHRWTRLEQLRFATEHGDPIGAPGEKFHYSDTAYVLLGEILERETGQSLPAAVRKLIGFRRLGLDHTYWETLEPEPTGEGDRAHQYYGTYDNIVLDASTDLYGGGGLVSTVGDLTRFYHALFHGKVFHDPATLKTMTRVAGPGKAEGGAMGIFAVDVDGERCFGHRGYWGTQTIHCPELDLTFAPRDEPGRRFRLRLRPARTGHRRPGPERPESTMTDEQTGETVEPRRLLPGAQRFPRVQSTVAAVHARAGADPRVAGLGADARERVRRPERRARGEGVRLVLPARSSWSPRSCPSTSASRSSRRSPCGWG